jgi:hypothetical protein
METKTIKQPKYSTKVTGYKNVTVYISEDGREFTSKKQAEEYEEGIEYNKKFNLIKNFRADLDFELNDEPWYYASSEEELEMIKHKIGFYDKYNVVHVYGELEVGSWITSRYWDGGDYRGTTSIYSLNYIKNEIQKFLDIVNNQ